MIRVRSRAGGGDRWRAIAGSVVTPVVLAILLSASILAYGVSHVVRHHLLDDRFYLQALEEERVYGRFYQQILADPALADAVDPLLGEFPSARPLLITALRLILPPDAIRRHADTTAREWERYLRGDTDDWRPQIDLRGVDRSIVEFLNAYVAGLVATTPEQDVQTVSEFREQAGDSLDDLSEGRLPESIPALQVSDPAEAEALAALLLGGARGPVPPETYEQVTAALTVGDTQQALSLAVPTYLTPRLRDAAARWRDQLEDGYRLDLIRSFEVLAQQPPGTVSQGLEEARFAALVLGEPLAAVSLLTAAASLAALMWILQRQGRSSLRWLGGALISTSAVGVLALLGVLVWFDALSDGALEQLPEQFPPALKVVLDDVAGRLASNVHSAMTPALVVLFVIGTLLLAGRWALERAHASMQMLRQRGWRAGVVVGAVVAGLLLVAFAEIGTAITEPDRVRCNGHYHLCDRPLDEVAFAGTHNSMAAASRACIFPNHDLGIEAQLNAGYRALLLDTHYWESRHTFLPFRDQLTEEHEQALLDLMLEVDPPRPGSYLCHSACALGATPLEHALTTIHQFLREHPTEVIIINFEDYISVEDTEAAFEASGLLSLVYRPDEDEEGWPTLRELIRRGERVIVLADHRGGELDWYLPYTDYVQDTPFNFRDVSDFSCRRNRGHSDSSLLLVNHWISTFPPDRSRAVVVNRQSILEQRIEECIEERGRQPNIIAVDFFAIGDTLLVVDELNAPPI